jgi:hypothetical protein
VRTSGGQDVLAAPEAEHAPVLFGVHPGVAHEDAAPEPPTPQILLDLLDCLDVGLVAREHPRPHRQSVARDGEPDDDLRRVIAAVLRVATLAQRGGSALVGRVLVLLVDLEVQ